MFYKIFVLVLLFSVVNAENITLSLNTRDNIILEPGHILYFGPITIEYYGTLDYSISSNIGNFGFAVVDEENFNLLKNNNPYYGYCIKENMIKTSGKCKMLYKIGYRIVIYSMNFLQNQNINYNLDYIDEPNENIEKEGFVYLNPLSYFSWEIENYNNLIELNTFFKSDIGNFQYGVFDKENAQLFKDLKACKCNCCVEQTKYNKQDCKIITDKNYELVIRSTNYDQVQFLTYNIDIGYHINSSNTIFSSFILLLILMF